MLAHEIFIRARVCACVRDSVKLSTLSHLLSFIAGVAALVKRSIKCRPMTTSTLLLSAHCALPAV